MEHTALIGIGALAALAIAALVLWRVLKLAIKVVVFVIAAATIAGVVAVAVAQGKVALPLPSSAHGGGSQ